MAYSQWDVDRAVTKAKEYETAGDTNKALEAYKWADHLRSTIKPEVKAPTPFTEQIKLINTPAPYTPKEFTPPNVNVLSDTDARVRAIARVDPLIQQARRDIGDVTQRQKLLLKERQGAAGELGSGGTIIGSANIDASLNKALGGLESQRGAQVEGITDQLVSQSREEANRTLDRAFQQYLGQEQIGMQAAGLAEDSRNNAIMRMLQAAGVDFQGKQLGLDEQRVGLEGKRVGLEEKRVGIDEGQYDLQKEMFGYQKDQDVKESERQKTIDDLTSRNIISQIQGVDPLTGKETQAAKESRLDRVVREKLGTLQPKESPKTALERVREAAANRILKGEGTVEDYALMGVDLKSTSGDTGFENLVKILSGLANEE